jgi:hypothetical protein
MPPDLVAVGIERLQIGDLNLLAALHVLLRTGEHDAFGTSASGEHELESPTLHLGQREVARRGTVRCQLHDAAGEDLEHTEHVSRSAVHVGTIAELAGALSLATDRVYVLPVGREHLDLRQLTIEEVDVLLVVLHQLGDETKEHVIVFATTSPQLFELDAHLFDRLLGIDQVTHAILDDFLTLPLSENRRGQGNRQQVTEQHHTFHRTTLLGEDVHGVRDCERFLPLVPVRSATRDSFVTIRRGLA